ncbi:outer membrane protein assembly factor [Bosea sp. SSUT16]|uniref:Outer membrane protein assembly factor n=1 Tax=Bosea spartocytisi TaxID=2773451 RepID=A0A927HYT5_9HYPH|nr:autotransporter assembly complex family protein [Bosea spartocytisi]MBD3844766.1 outer membrane protein assembly factor [Bosea spartocytisi]MCT4470968.1 autotransporter assembly complex protein TamA [Bosea spartocytisi]
MRFWRRASQTVALGGGYAFAALVGLQADPAKAFDLSSLDVFGLFTRKDEPPAPSAATLPYKLDFDLGEADDAKALTRTLQDASLLYRLRQDAPPDGETLSRRMAADLNPLVDALWSQGYFNADVSLVVDGVPLAVGAEPGAPLIRALEAHRNRDAVPITVRVRPGKVFSFRKIDIVERDRGGSAAIADPLKVSKLKAGEPATAASLRAAQAGLIDHMRAQSHPLAKVVELRPVVDHAAGIMDVTYVLDPGPLAGFGDITVGQTDEIPPEVVRSFIYLEPGDPYSPKALADTRKSIAKIPAVASVRIREADKLDGAGNLPIFVEVTERPKRLLGFSARYSTIDGPAVKVYWEHRNLFGGAERLRLESSVFFAPRIDGTKIQRFGDFERSDLGGRFAFSFMKPALDGSRYDWLLDGVATRERVGTNRYGGYTARYANATTAIRYRFSDTFSVQAGLEVERGQTSDVLGQVDYTLVGLPLSVNYDSTDSLLDPTRGIRATASFTPYPTFLGSTVGIYQAKAAVSGYYALDEDARYVLAGRVGFGSISGASLDEIPATRRFYAGGGGSVRGYAYRSLSPLGPFGQLTGGRSLLELSAEARIKITETIGIVPFFDAGTAFESSLPDGKQKLQMAAGLGFRYYTSIGPIRVDVAAPLNPRKGDKPVALYVSIGQAF